MEYQKPFWESSTFWFNVVLTVISLASYFQTILPSEFIPYSVAIQGIGNVILRVWFTTTETLGLSKR